MKIPTRSPRSTGFSLVELLVVIGVIGVLLALLLPTLSRARESASRVACAQNLRSIHAILQIYTNESKTLPAPSVSASYPYAIHYPDALGPSGGGAIGQPKYDTGRWLFRYIKNPQIFFCPSATWNAPGGLETSKIQPEFWPKTDQELSDHGMEGTYLLLVDRAALRIGPGNTVNNHWGSLELPDPKMKGGARVLLGFDCTWTQSQMGNSSNPWQIVNRFNHMRDAKPAGANALYLDGHVDWTSIEHMTRELNPGLATYRVPDDAESRK
jgi:prepilin-type N-terminal cleavage/methylation domain-containing protein/prepilin-type processing-associated H-X9-DG protein